MQNINTILDYDTRRWLEKLVQLRIMFKKYNRLNCGHWSSLISYNFPDCYVVSFDANDGEGHTCIFYKGWIIDVYYNAYIKTKSFPLTEDEATIIPICPDEATDYELIYRAYSKNPVWYGIFNWKRAGPLPTLV